MSMAAHGSRRLIPMAENLANIVAIEWLAATQGCDFHAPLRSSEALEAARALLRGRVPTLDEDRLFTPDIEAAAAMVRDGSLVAGLDLPAVAP